MLEIGSVLDGKYKILSEIGHGGMSVVYLALNERANKTWAVKEVRKDGGTDNEIISQGLIAETEMLKRLNHPNLPSIVDVIDKSDTFIIVMDYIEGRSLQSVLNHKGAQEPEQVLEWSKQLCDVLGYLHSRQPAIIYRDMKPANVMLKPDGQVALIDFGTAREYKEHSQGDTTWLGTRGYAAPEQFGGRGQTDARTDIYCLGATMYHLLTGFSPADTQFVIYPLGQLVPSLEGSGLEKVVAKCCEPDPANRYQSCAELMYALEHVHDEDAKSIKDRNRKWRLFVSCLTLTIIGLLGLIGFGISNRVAESKSYSQELEKAKRLASFEEKERSLAKVISIKPERIEGYEVMLDTIIDPESDEGRYISSREQSVMEQSVDAYMNEFKSGNRDGYLTFQFDRGKKYFSFFRGNKRITKAILDEIIEDERLGEDRKKIAESLSALCEIYINNETRVVETTDGSDVTIYDVQGNDSSSNDEYRKLWMNIYSLISDPDMVDDLTGGDQTIAITMYREMARQIQYYRPKYLSAGVTKEQMLNLLEAGKKYVSDANTDKDEVYEKFVSDTLEEIDLAEAQLTQNKKTDLGAGSAPSSEVLNGEQDNEDE